MRVKRKKSIILRLLVIGIAVYGIFTLVGLWNELSESEAKLKQYEEQKQATEAEIEEYTALLSDGSQKSIVEKAARERFGFSYANEEIYKEIK